MTSLKTSRKRIGRALGLLALGLVLLVGSSSYGQAGDVSTERVVGTTGNNGNLDVEVLPADPPARSDPVRLRVTFVLDCSKRPHLPLKGAQVVIDITGSEPLTAQNIRSIQIYSGGSLFDELTPDEFTITPGNPTIISPKLKVAPNQTKICLQAGPPAPGRRVMDPPAATPATSDPDPGDPPLPGIPPAPSQPPPPNPLVPAPGLVAIWPPNRQVCGCSIMQVTITVDPPMGDFGKDKRTDNKPERKTRGYHDPNRSDGVVKDPLETVVTIRLDTNEADATLSFDFSVDERTLYVATTDATTGATTAAGINLDKLGASSAIAVEDPGERSCLHSPIIIKVHVYDLILRLAGQGGRDTDDDNDVRNFITQNTPRGGGFGNFYTRTRLTLTITFKGPNNCTGRRSVPITYDLGPIPIEFRAGNYRIQTPTVPVAVGPLARWHP
jgi:hypothetical protein